MLADARDRQFDVVVAEALDQLSRDQEDVAGRSKHLRVACLGIVTATEGPIPLKAFVRSRLQVAPSQSQRSR